MLDPRGIINLRTKQMNLLKMHEMDFRRVMDIYRKFDGGSAVSEDETRYYDAAIAVLKQRNILDYFLERFSKDNRASVSNRAANEEKALVEDMEDEKENRAEEKLDGARHFNLAMHRLDQKMCTWLVDVLDKYLKTNRKMDNRISLEFKYLEKKQDGVVGQVLFLAWSSCKLELPVVIEKRNNMLFIKGTGLEIAFDSEGRINVLDTSCLKVLVDRTGQQVRV